MTGDGYYASAAWEKVRLVVLRRDKWACVRCGVGVRGSRAGQSTPHVDHILARRKGGADTPANLQTLCARCHSLKTTQEDYNTKAGVGEDGLPPGWEC